jgi:hypothetical protein
MTISFFVHYFFPVVCFRNSLPQELWNKVTGVHSGNCGISKAQTGASSPGLFRFNVKLAPQNETARSLPYASDAFSNKAPSSGRLPANSRLQGGVVPRKIWL